MRARVLVKVTAAANGWFRIHEAFEDEALTGQPAVRQAGRSPSARR
ncbi:hypothetical protein [Roseateles chitinivorans]|nr:hypothetical protein [Roseateles chitinivorans]